MFDVNAQMKYVCLGGMNRSWKRETVAANSYYFTSVKCMLCSVLLTGLQVCLRLMVFECAVGGVLV